MAHLGSRRQRALALPVGLALTASLGFLPGTAASAAPLDESAATATATGPKMSYVVNTKGGHGASASVKRAIARAGGTVVKAYDQIGVIVVHSQNPDFGQQIRRAKGVSSAGATRTAPLTPVGITEEGTTQKLSATEAAKAAPRRRPVRNRWRRTSGTSAPSVRTRQPRSTTAAVTSPSV